jgi:hypothetical protein
MLIQAARYKGFDNINSVCGHAVSRSCMHTTSRWLERLPS